ncbi:hypothetical protein GH714_015027 [Hevea brasiliensis]|uniref:RRM domain-containing protein n=1 Tax=Hevea brasiliensis TaxID=3981 RepID=A0A6A6LXK1_HEVBR|nr:hypothetical protein GH714_015027 [Hevea brasiliensis]
MTPQILSTAKPFPAHQHPDPSWHNHPTTHFPPPINKKRNLPSIYLENFPSNWRAKDLRNAFSKLGVIKDVYIPNRLNRGGQRFGFMRVLSSSWMKELLSILSTLWIGSYKLRAYQAKHSQYHSLVPSPANQNVTQPNTAVPIIPNVNNHKKPSNTNTNRHNKPLQDPYRDQKQNPEHDKNRVLGVFDICMGQPQWDNSQNSYLYGGRYQIPIEVETTNLSSLSRSVIATLRNVHSLNNLQIYLESEGVFSIEVFPFGGDMVLLTLRTMKL